MILIEKGHVMDPSQGIDGVGDVLIEDEKIVEIRTEGHGETKKRRNRDVQRSSPNLRVSESPSHKEELRIIHAEGMLVIPGLIDMHVHLREPGFEYKETIKTGFKRVWREVLQGVTFHVPRGAVAGYLGVNGAGKTTTIKTILGLIFPDAGTVEILGRSHLSPHSRETLGFLPENPYFYDYRTADEFLAFYADLFGLPRGVRDGRIASLLKLVGLTSSARLPLRKFSRGMLQRVGLAQALINDPRVVILDEPLGGMDPLGRKEIRDIIVRFKEI